MGEAVAGPYPAQGARLILSARRTPRSWSGLKESCTYPDKINQDSTLDLTKNHEAQSWTEPGLVPFCMGLISLINNGGIGQFGSVQNTAMAVERKLMEVEFFGNIALTKALLPKMLETGKGHILNVASIAGKFGQANLAAYSASTKAAVILYYESLYRKRWPTDDIKNTGSKPRLYKNCRYHNLA
ncbi:MAG: SDR family NAD(P)-dependent oxidoreductase [Owenweeksia sp.]|nr:SDR family NAD(P)-dependent oxidoreductase [Owenweeksia sp.]